MQPTTYQTPQPLARNSTMPTSRLVKKQQQSLLRQSAMFLVAAVVLAIGCIVFIPIAIRFLGGKVDPNSLNAADDVPPQVPVLYAPLEATSSAKFVIQGYTEKDAEVVLVNNGTQVAKQPADDSGNFSFEFDLQSGDNTLTTYAVNEKGTESQTSQEYKVVFDNEAPKLEVSEPTETATIQGKKNQNLTIKGKSEANVHITINDRMVTVDVDGNFNGTFRLIPGQNDISVKAIDVAGNTTEKKLTITYNE